MPCNPVLIDLLGHVGSTSEPIVINWDNIQQWPLGALECLVQAGVLTPASSAKSIECNGCEHHCFMDVLMLSGNRVFVVCDEPDMQAEIGRVSIPLERLQQWRTGFKQLAVVIAELLGFDGRVEYKPEQNFIRLGMLNSKGGRRWVSVSNQPLVLEINGFKTPVSDLLFFNDGVLVIDHLSIDDLVNAKPLSVSKAYVPTTDKQTARKLATQAKYQDWEDEYASLQLRHPAKSKIWFSRQISKLPIAQGADSETIRKHLK